jgi:O-antigen/teichoic acid export membrane protein
MLDKLKPKSEFARNVLTLMTGTTIAQAIPIAISPILTRIYTPEDFGMFALYMSVASIISVVATGGYEHAIMLPKRDNDSIHLVILSLLITFLFSLFILFIVFVFNTDIVNLLGNEEISNWLYFIPFSVLFTGVYQSFNYWTNRKKKYKILALSKITRSSTTAISNLGMGINHFGGVGLILGTIFGQILSIIILFRKKSFLEMGKINKIRVYILAKKYIDFLKFSTFSSILNSLSFNLFSILISKLFSSSILGFYHLVFRILTLPSTLIGSSISQVYFEESTRQKNRYGNNHKIFIATLKKLLFISLLIYLPMYFYIEDLMIFVFGSEWKISGEIAQILIPLMFIRFISSILSSTLTTYEKQKSGLFINFTLALNIVILVSISDIYNLDYITFFYFYMVVSSLLYFLFLFYYYKLSKGEKIEKTIN